jgi:Lipid desaturase domain
VSDHCTSKREQPIQHEWSSKQIEFADAMGRYERFAAYAHFTRAVSWSIMALQITFVLLLCQLQLGLALHIAAFLLAFMLADFVNGLVHLIMDHSQHYASAVGPLIASFHLHHDVPRYRDKLLWRVYVEESGSKVWLLLVALLLLVLIWFDLLPVFMQFVGVYFVVFSSVAEVSHYLCHNHDSPVVRSLQRLLLILPRVHHFKHHRLDNINYAFLNGMTDPLLNWIAKTYYQGYICSTDQHLKLYQYQKQHSCGSK